MITKGLKSPNDLYLEAKNQNMNRYGGFIYITLSHNMLFCLLVNVNR